MADAIAALPEQGKVTILETGPLTCVAEMLRECGPAVRERIARIVWMGGAVDVEGNVNMKVLEAGLLFFCNDSLRVSSPTCHVSVRTRILTGSLHQRRTTRPSGMSTGMPPPRGRC